MPSHTASPQDPQGQAAPGDGSAEHAAARPAGDPAKPTSAETALRFVMSLERGDDLARVVHGLGLSAAEQRRPVVSDGAAEMLELAGLSRTHAETPWGNLLAALEPGALVSPALRWVLAALAGRGAALALEASEPGGVSSSPARSRFSIESGSAADRIADALSWVAGHTQLPAVSALDAALGPNGDGVWRALAAIVRRADAGQPSITRPQALVAAAAIATSSSPVARTEAEALARELGDPLLAAALVASVSGSAHAGSLVVSGELVPPPRGPVALVLLSPVLAPLHLIRLAMRWVLGHRRAAEISFDERGVTVSHKVELLGRKLSERREELPAHAIVVARREVRFPRLTTYAGLFALAIGSWLGASLFVDGARAGSPELLAIGALLAALGIGVDFGLAALGSGRGRCRIVLVPRKGRAIALQTSDRDLADRALSLLRSRN